MPIRALSLRKLLPADKEQVCLWIRSPVIMSNSFVALGPRSSVREIDNFAARYFEFLMSDSNRQTYAILMQDKIIGTIGLKDINYNQADCFIDIGEQKLRGQGLGRQAMNLILNIGFASLKLTEISLDVLEFNKAALKLYVNLGFVMHNNFTWHYDEFAMYWRVLRMSLTRNNWLNRGSKHVL